MEKNTEMSKTQGSLDEEVRIKIPQDSAATSPAFIEGSLPSCKYIKSSKKINNSNLSFFCAAHDNTASKGQGGSA